jgi:phage protein D
MSSPASAKNRRSTEYKLSFPTMPSFKALPRRVDLYQEPYRHDIMVIEFPKISDTWYKHLKTGVPVHFRWVQGQRARSWYGYVNTVSKHVVGQKETVMEITCVGASYPLKQRAQAVYKNKTIPDIAISIAKKFNLHYSVERHSRVFPYIAMAGESYWEWLNEYAKLIGYVCYMDGVTLVFKPIDKLIDTGVKDIAILSMGAAELPINNQIQDRTLDSLKVLNGDYVEGSDNASTSKVVGGVDPLTGKVITSSDNPKAVGRNLRVEPTGVLFKEYRTGQVANDATTIGSISSGAAQLARFSIPAEVSCQGDPRIKPYAPIHITGTGSLTDGFWLTMKAHHMFHRVGDYQMVLKVATDGIGANAVDPFRNSDSTTIGIIDVESILSSNQPLTNATRVQVKLNGTAPRFTEGSQGFALSPVYWEVSYQTKEGCCS